MRTVLYRISYLLMAAGLIIGLVGCGNNNHNDSPQTASFQVELSNLTANQPLVPIAAILHGPGFSGWQVGTPVSAGLEQLAESGSPAAFLAEAGASGSLRDSQAGSGVVLPGASTQITLTGVASDARLTLASMLVNTNDAFTGIADRSLAGLQVGQKMTFEVSTYDAGTEANRETSATVPGPAGGGEGFNPVRDDRDFVTIHSGIVSADDGLATSALNQSHRFQNPAALLVITRIQ